MTFEEFQATRKPASAAELQEAGVTPNEQTFRGLLYAGTLYIESTEGWGPCETEGAWYLILERSEYISDDLPQLERTLYNWGIQAGNIEGQSMCALCRAIIDPEDGPYWSNGVVFCSESCRQEAEEA